jgi:hypothetical protein
MLKRFRSATTRASKTAEKKLLRLERRLPILTDFAEDRVFYRGLNIALFTLVLLFIIRAGLFVIFLQFPIRRSGQGVINIEGSLPSTTIDFGSPLLSFKVLVTQLSGKIPAAGRNISLRIELANANLLELPENGFENTITHLTGVALKGSFSIPGFPPKIMETPKLIGNSELTDTDGYATFRGFQLQTGIPGSYVITAIDTVSGRTKKLGKVKMTSSIATAIILEDGRQKLKFGRRGLPPRIVSGESIPIIRVKILNSKREGIPNKVCVLTSASKEAAEFSNVGARPDVFHPRLVVINNQFSSISNFSGFVEFRNVTLATSIRHVRLWAVCDGRVANYEGSSVKSIIFLASRKYFQTHTLLASIVQQPSTEVLEGEAFARQPSVLL